MVDGGCLGGRGVGISTLLNAEFRILGVLHGVEGVICALCTVESVRP